MKKSAKVIIICIIILIIAIGVIIFLITHHRGKQKSPDIPETGSVEELLPEEDVFDQEGTTTPSSSDTPVAVTTIDNNYADKQDETDKKPADVQTEQSEEMSADTQEDQSNDYYLPEDYFD